MLAEVLDARLHALWDPAGADDRLAAAAEIIDLARAAADPEQERRGLFWRFVALMELGRVGEAESALAAFEREARVGGDAAALVMVAARHAMLATQRGRFDEAQQLIEDVAEQGRQAGLADTERLVGTLRGMIAMLRGDLSGGERAVSELRAFARRIPGHFYDATAARVLLSLERTAEADLELQHALPRLLAGSGPRCGGRRHGKQRRRSAAVRGARRLPRPAGRMGRCEHDHRTRHPLSRDPRRPARPYRRCGRPAGGRGCPGGPDRRAAVAGSHPGRARRCARPAPRRRRRRACLRLSPTGPRYRTAAGHARAARVPVSPGR